MIKLKDLMVICASVLIVGCGGGSSSDTYTPSAPSVDNSVLADDENQYGYFGEDVIFGGIEVTGGWNLYNRADMEESLYASLGSDGEGWIRNQQDFTSVDFDYGVSKDGKVIKTSYEITIEIIEVLKDYLHVNYDGAEILFDCYYVKYNDWTGAYDVNMCPSGRF